MEEEKKPATNTVTRAEYETLMEEVKKLRRGEIPVYDESIENERFVSIRMIDGMPIVRWDEKMVNMKNEKGEWGDFITVYALDGKKENKIELEYLQFIRNVEKVKAKIIDDKVKFKTIIQGFTTKKYVKDGAYRTINTGIKVPVKVQIPESLLTVEMPDGSKLEINSNYVN